MAAQLYAVDPHFGIHVNAVKLDDDPIALKLCRKDKYLTIPSRSAGGKTTAHLADGIRVKRRTAPRQVFDAPIVRKIDLPPTRVVKSKSLRPERTAMVKTPLGVKLDCPLRGIGSWKRRVRSSPSRLKIGNTKHQAQIEQPSGILLFHFFSFLCVVRFDGCTLSSLGGDIFAN